MEDRAGNFVGMLGVCVTKRKQDKPQSMYVTTLKKSEGRVIGNRRVIRIKEKTAQNDIHSIATGQQRQLAPGSGTLLPGRRAG